MPLTSFHKRDILVVHNLSFLAFFSLLLLIKNSCYFVLNFSIIRFRYGHKKRTKETPRSPLFTGFAARFARAYARRKKCVIYVCSTRERERERERVYNYLELPNYLLSFSRLEMLKNPTQQYGLHLYYIRRKR